MGQTADELRHQLEEQRRELGDDLVAIGDRVSPGRMVERRRAKVGASFRSAREAVMGAADTATSSVGDTMGSATSRVGEAASTLGDRVASAPDQVRTQTQGSPFAAAAIAFGVGALAGSLLPKTRLDDQAAERLQPMLESAATDVGEQAQDLLGAVKEDAAEAAGRVQGTAQEAVDAVKTEATVGGDAAGGAPSGDPTTRAATF